jgi:phage I-like protein
MKNKLTESNLRDIIRGVIQEMFDEDLQEDANLPGLDDAEKDEAMELAAEAGSETMVDLEEQVEDIEEGTKKGDKLKDDEGGRGDKKDDEAYVNEEEKAENLQESFLPKGRDIRAEARRQTFEKLVSKWCK